MFEVWKNEVTAQHSLYSIFNIKAGDTICDFGASAILQTPSYLTIQVNSNEHICLHPSFLQYTNHSCSPNIFFDTNAFKVIALQMINAGDELTYFYPSTEWEMAQPFQCVCGSDNCLGNIGGASYLSKKVIAGYRFSDFIFKQLTNKFSL